ncbi:hypothetical protein HMI54_010798 [Coelomomyces lativittatus]|nr:hypothetical protein HMI56_000147 [Coelomomyces lativittatus]KAJ1516112.1 hypothetical protein HMI54_010798 [Coelomomyces lativittatus]
MAPSLFDIEEQMVFYASYHSHPVNKWIHIVCVPALVWTVFVFFSTVPAWILLGFYSVYYMCLDSKAFILYFPCLCAMGYSANQFSYVPHAYTYALMVHVAAWVLQILGHQVFEKRSPAFLDSFSQAFLLAPFFVWLEVLFSMRYRQDLAERIHTKAQQQRELFFKKQRSTTAKLN